MDSSVLSRFAPPLLESNFSHNSPASNSPASNPQAPETQAPETQAPETQFIQSIPAAPMEERQDGFRQEIRIFLSTFFTIFLAELGDKTQVTTLLMSAESNAPWIVFLGAGSALIATSLLGVWLGHWLSKRVSTRTLETSAAAMLLLISAMLLWDVVQG